MEIQLTERLQDEAKIEAEIDPEVEAMAGFGLHMGHATSRRNPGMTPYLWGVRNNIEIIDLTKTKERLIVALGYLREIARGGKTILFVGTRPVAREAVRVVSQELGVPYVNGRWIGGTLTNFRVILKRIEAMEALEGELASGALSKYTKWEELQKQKELLRLKENFDGLRLLKRLPDAVVILGLAHDKLALAEAERMQIPVVAITDTDTDPRRVAYPIPANDDAKPSIEFILNKIREAIRDGRNTAAAEAAAASAPPELGAETPNAQ